MGAIGELIHHQGSAMLFFAEKALEGVTPERFARAPVAGGQTVETNHPAFILGHLAIYPHRMLELVGQDPGPAAVPDSYETLFSAKEATCKDDANGDVYPPMDDVKQRFFETHRHALDVLRAQPDSVYEQANPREDLRERFPTVGAMAGFMFGPHAFLHLGQLSAWRRVEGLGPCM